MNIPDSLSSAHLGACFVDIKTNEPLFAHQADQLFIPASLTKLFTTAAALQIFPEHLRLRTSVFLHGIFSNTMAIGSLVLCGGGDPTFTSKDLFHLAQQIYQKGIRKIKGKILSNDDFFQGTHLPYHLEWSDLTWGYAPEISALSIDQNALNLNIQIKENQSSVTLSQLIPYCKAINRIKIVKQVFPPKWFQNNDKPFPFIIKRGLQNNHILIEGEIPHGTDPIEEKIALHNPSEYARQLFIFFLNQLGIEIIDSNEDISNTQTELAFIESPPISKILHLINKESDNLASELVIRLIGKHLHSSPNSYLEIALQYIENMNKKFYPQNSILHDGAGISRQNLVSPKLVVNLLQSFKQNPSFVNSLPIGAVDGTLKDRMKEAKNKVFAKTGTMTGITNLAGYLKTDLGKNVAFCLCINNHRLSTDQCQEEIDEFIFKFLKNN